MSRALRSRKTANLSSSVHRRLNLYTIAAGAAGVSSLALAMPAQAEIVYTATQQTIGVNSTYSLDLNNDGTTDFILHDRHGHTTSGTAGSLFIAGSGTNGAEGAASSRGFLAANLPPGVNIPTGQFARRARLGFFCAGFLSCSRTSSKRGHWFNVANRYLGLKFAIDGQTHYGWARLSVRFKDYRLVAMLTGYAYETIPDKPIIAGQEKGNEKGNDDAAFAPLTMPTPAQPSLAMLPLGTPGLAIWRREESAVTALRNN
jgi:hypothetical protein